MAKPLRAAQWTVHGPFVSGLRAAASRRLASDTRLRAQSRFLLARKTGAPARPAAWGEEEGTERAEFLPTTWGVHCTSHRWLPIHPARKGE